jgi:hypothetical protein
VIPEDQDDIILWILTVQREHLEILPDLEAKIREAEMLFDPHESPDRGSSTISSTLCVAAGLRQPSPNGRRQPSPNSKAYPSSVPPVVVAPLISSPLIDRTRELSRANQNSSMVSTPESKTRPSTPVVSASSPVLVHRSSPAQSVLLSAARTSPATSTHSGMSPCGSARKLSDNAIRTLPAPLANLARDNTVNLKLADRLGTGSPPLGPVRLNVGGHHASTRKR